MTPITVLLAEDHAIVREGIRALLSKEDDIQVVGVAVNGRQAVKQAVTLSPDVVIMDIAMPLLNGLEATRQTLLASPKTKVILLSAYSDDVYVEQARAVGAAGYLVKQSAACLLSKAIRQVHLGKPFFSPSIHERILRQQKEMRLESHSPHPATSPPRLSSREMEVLQLVAEGMANKQSAAVLDVSVKTVEKHRQSLMGKLNIHETAGLTRYAVAHGVIENSSQLTTEP